MQILPAEVPIALIRALAFDFVKALILVTFIEEALLEDLWKNAYNRVKEFNWKGYCDGWQPICGLGFLGTALLHGADVVVAVFVAYGMMELLKVAEDFCYLVKWMLKKGVTWTDAENYISTWNPEGMWTVGLWKFPKWFKGSLGRAGIMAVLTLTYIYGVQPILGRV